MGVAYKNALLILVAVDLVVSASFPPKLGHGTGCRTISPPPSNKICETAGKLNEPKLLSEPQKYNTYMQCRDLCSRHSLQRGVENRYAGCKSFGFSTIMGRCDLYAASLSKQSFVKNSSSGNKFWDLDCFNCPSACPQPLNANLLDNSGFELPLLGPWNVSTSGYKTSPSITSPGLNSARAYKCEGDACSLRQSFETCLGSYYHLVFDYRIPTTVSPHNFPMYVSAGTFYVTIRARPSGNWEHAEAWYIAGHKGNNQLEISPQFPNNAKKPSIELDNIEITRVSGAFHPKPNAPELVQNGGFENGKFTPWRHGRGTSSKLRIVKPGIESRYGLRFTGFEYDGAIIVQQVPVELGKSYLFRYMMTKTKNNTLASFGTTIYDGILPDLPRYNYTADSFNFSLPFYATRSPVRLLFVIYAGPINIDNFSVRELAT